MKHVFTDYGWVPKGIVIALMAGLALTIWLSTTIGGASPLNKTVTQAIAEANLVVTSTVLGLDDSKPQAQTRRSREAHWVLQWESGSTPSIHSKAVKTIKKALSNHCQGKLEWVRAIQLACLS